jgi:cobalt-zinc-cadmium efflux system outer membrane protein
MAAIFPILAAFLQRQAVRPITDLRATARRRWPQRGCKPLRYSSGCNGSSCMTTDLLPRRDGGPRASRCARRADAEVTTMSAIALWRWLPATLIVLLALAGCHTGRQVRQKQQAQIAAAMARAEEPLLLPAAPTAPWPIAGPRPLEEYIDLALQFNPAIDAARRRAEAMALRIPQEGSLEDPMLSVMGWPFLPNVPQTAAGRITAGMTVSQRVPWFGKRRSRAEMAAAEVHKAWAELRAIELEVVEQVKRWYYELYYLQQAIELIEADRRTLEDLARVAEERFRNNQVSQQDVHRAHLEILAVDDELLRMRQELASAQAQLARWLHLPPDSPLQAVDRLPQQDVPAALDALYAQALEANPELQAQLAEIRKQTRAVRLAELAYYPDVELSVTWDEMTRRQALAPTSDGLDMVGLGLMINLPLYRARLDAAVREAQSRTAAEARQWDALKDRTQAEVRELFVQAQTQQELLALFREQIVPKAQDAFRASIPAYRVNQVDFQQLVDNWRALLRYRITLVRLEAQLRQTLATLERVVGGSVAEPMPAAN